MQHLRHIDWIYCKYCIYQNGRNLQFIVEKGSSVGGNGINIPLNNNEDVTMFGNKVGVKRGSTIHFYDEKGKPAGTRQV